MLVFGNGETVNAKYSSPRIVEKAEDLSMNNAKPRNTSVSNEATNLVRADHVSLNGAGSL